MTLDEAMMILCIQDKYISSIDLKHAYEDQIRDIEKFKFDEHERKKVETAYRTVKEYRQNQNWIGSYGYLNRRYAPGQEAFNTPYRSVYTPPQEAQKKQSGLSDKLITAISVIAAVIGGMIAISALMFILYAGLTILQLII